MTGPLVIVVESWVGMVVALAAAGVSLWSVRLSRRARRSFEEAERILRGSIAFGEEMRRPPTD